MRCVEQTVYKIEHRAVLCIEHIDDIVVGLVKVRVVVGRVDEYLSFVVEIFRLHRKFLHAFEWNLPLSRHCNEGKQDGDDDLFVHCFTSPINFVVVLMIHFQIIYVPLLPKTIKRYGL